MSQNQRSNHIESLTHTPLSLSFSLRLTPSLLLSSGIQCAHRRTHAPRSTLLPSVPASSAHNTRPRTHSFTYYHHTHPPPLTSAPHSRHAQRWAHRPPMFLAPSSSASCRCANRGSPAHRSTSSPWMHLPPIKNLSKPIMGAGTARRRAPPTTSSYARAPTQMRLMRRTKALLHLKMP